MAIAIPERDEDFQYYNFFFYGPLTDPDLLMSVAHLKEKPELQDGWIDGYTMKLWQDLYPVVLPSDDNGPQSRIYGKIWQAVTAEEILGLQQWERSPCRPAHC